MTIVGRLRNSALVRKMLRLDRCVYCGKGLAPGEGERAPGFGRYCSAEHADLAQTFTM